MFTDEELEQEMLASESSVVCSSSSSDSDAKEGSDGSEDYESEHGDEIAAEPVATTETAAEPVLEGPTAAPEATMTITGLSPIPQAPGAV